MGRLVGSLIAICLLCLTGCTWTANTRPSFLIVAAENLNSESLDCDSTDEDYTKGIAALCAEGVRFTHAYTTSVLSQSAMASILTGLYPENHHVRNNGEDYLSERLRSVAEVALDQGYRTSFISGGAPIWRKSGFAKGFELFDDAFSLTPKHLYRPFHASLGLFFNWLATTDQNEPFFSVIYANDLQFEGNQINDSDINPVAADDTRLHRFAERISYLVTRLKKQHLWRNTNVVLVGLNGISDESRNEVDTLNLFDENTRIFLLFKPAHKDRDDNNSWDIDKNVSLADLGNTLFDLLHVHQAESRANSSIQTISFKSALENPQANWSGDRIIPVESAWAAWRGVGRIRYAFRKGQILYIYDRSAEIFNSLTDRFETQNVTSDDPTVHGSVAAIQKFIKQNGILPFIPIPSNLHDKIVFAQELYSGDGAPDDSTEVLAGLAKERPWDEQLVGWQAKLALRQQNWKLLLQLGHDHSEPVWSYVARRQLGENPQVPNDNCLLQLRILAKKQKPRGRCYDREFVRFAEWVNSGVIRRSLSGDRFFREYDFATVKERAIEQNFDNGLPWDTIVDSSGRPRLVNLILTLPEFRIYQGILSAR